MQTHNDLEINIDDIILFGDLVIPDKAKSIVLFAHGSGSSRFSPRNRQVATVLNQAGIATLLMDLMTKQEENIDQYNAELRFDIDLLAERLIKTSHWVQKNALTRNFKQAYFGASTGAAAAIQAAAAQPEIAAVVSRGGRPDLADEDALSKISCPTLFIVGGADLIVIELNQEAYLFLNCVKKLEIVPHATHLFEEPGTLEKVSELAADWFKLYL